MALEHELENLDDLTDEQKSFYEEKSGGGGFVVSQKWIDAGIETTETIAPLRNIGDNEKKLRAEQNEKHIQEKNELQKRLDKLEAEQDEARRKAAKSSGNQEDIDALLASQEKKFGAERETLQGQIDRLNRIVEDRVVKAEAKSLTAELAVDDGFEALYPHIEKRLTMTEKDGEPVVQVLGADGKPTVDTLEDLKKELRASTSLSRLIKGTKASGGGADPNKPGGGASKTDGSVSKLSRQEKVDRVKRERAAGRRERNQ